MFEVMEEDIPPTTHAVAEAQRLTGEVMWLAHKTRPDVAFTSSLMASITLRAPSRCIAIGHKVLRYLPATKNLRMAIQSDGGDLILYPDAAFAPNSGRSHTGWTVYWQGLQSVGAVDANQQLLCLQLKANYRPFLTERSGYWVWRRCCWTSTWSLPPR